MVDPPAAVVLPMVLGSLGLYLTFYLLHKKRRPRPLEYVGTVKELYFHPIKSCRGVTLQEAECTWMGLRAHGMYDRQFLLCDPSDGNRVVNLKRKCRLALVTSKMGENCDEIEISFPGMEKLTLPKAPSTDCTNKIVCNNWTIDFDAVDCGDAAAEWINKALETNRPLRLVYAVSGMAERAAGFVNEDGDIIAGDDKKLAPQFVLPEQCTVNLLSQASLDELNKRLESDVSIRHFRPNVVVEGCSPNDEDSWEEIVINEASFFQFDLAERCFITTIDPDNPEVGHYKKEPLVTLRTYRRKPGWDGPVFGVRLGLRHRGSIKVGDKVYARRKLSYSYGI
ncbi:mitochondrial amidoxime reducing component 2-like [Lineus longissimus]|uniref:mitochondrial amidoxime reducing component 2-like n=1 Tax=Lineus longissimus TaxID=88925 RepID=UPI00315D60EA